MTTASNVNQEAGRMRLTRDSFDVAIQGWAELVATGDFDGAEAIARSTFANWDRERRVHPRWADRYITA